MLLRGFECRLGLESSGRAKLVGPESIYRDWMRHEALPAALISEWKSVTLSKQTRPRVTHRRLLGRQASIHLATAWSDAALAENCTERCNPDRNLNRDATLTENLYGKIQPWQKLVQRDPTLTETCTERSNPDRNLYTCTERCNPDRNLYRDATLTETCTDATLTETCTEMQPWQKLVQRDPTLTETCTESCTPENWHRQMQPWQKTGTDRCNPDRKLAQTDATLTENWHRQMQPWQKTGTDRCNPDRKLAQTDATLTEIGTDRCNPDRKLAQSDASLTENWHRQMQAWQKIGTDRCKPDKKLADRCKPDRKLADWCNPDR